MEPIVWNSSRSIIEPDLGGDEFFTKLCVSSLQYFASVSGTFIEQQKPRHKSITSISMS
jgi:hypothetical protein